MSVPERQPEAFARWLQQGLGRVHRFLQQNDAAPYRDLILHACTHNLAYDRQCEPIRGQYLFEIIGLTGEKPFYRERVLAALANPQEDECEIQMFEIAQRLAQEGDTEAGETMYARFVQNALEGDYTGGEEIVLLDGAAGLAMFSSYLRDLDWEEDGWEVDSWVEALEEREGREVAWQTLRTYTPTSPALETLLAGCEQFRRQWEAKRAQRQAASPRSDFGTLQRQVQERGLRGCYGLLRTWSRQCQSESEWREAAQALEQEADPELLKAYLYLFRYRAFPLAPECLIALTRSEDAPLSRSAFQALEQVQHDSVRAFGLEQMETEEGAHWGIKLLTRNYQAGDGARIEARLLRVSEGDDFAFHSIGIATKQFLKAHPTEEGTRTLLALYERGPCSLCRSDAVERLLERQALPSSLRVECRHDAYAETRKLVAV